MDIAYIDQLANNNNSYLHRASVFSKVLFAIIVLAATIIGSSSIELGLVFLSLVIILKSAGLPAGKIIHFSLYPAFFSLLFAGLRFYYSFDEGMSIILKAVNGAIIMVILVTTTPYPNLFSFFRVFLPQIIVDAMFFTYRILFILIDKVKNILTIIKLKGGFRWYNITFNIRNLAGAIGVLFINSFDMLERMYNIYSLRGYEGNLHVHSKWYKLNRIDFIPLIIALILLVMVVVF